MLSRVRRPGIDKLRLTYLSRAGFTTNTQVQATMVASTSCVRRSLFDAQCQRPVGLGARNFRSALQVDRAQRVVD